MLTSSQLRDILSIAKERLRSGKGRLPIEGGGTWDTRVREFFYDEMFEILKEEFGVDNPNEYLYVEGRNRSARLIFTLEDKNPVHPRAWRHIPRALSSE